MSHVDSSALSQYNSLLDPHLSGYFNNTRMRKHLRKAGMIDKRGEIVTENTYRLNMARKEHKGHVRELLAQAIVNKTLDMERNRQVTIRKKLEEIAKIELVRRVRSERGRRGDEEILPYLSPRSRSRPTSAYTPAGPARAGTRPKSAPAARSSSRKRNQSPASDRLVAVDENGIPLTPRERSGSITSDSTVGQSRGKKGKKSKYPKGDIDDRHLYALDQHTLREYKMAQYNMQYGRGPSPFLYPQPGLPAPPKTGSPRAHVRGRMRIAHTDSQGRPLRAKTNKPSLLLHRKEPAMKHQTQLQTGCQVTMHYFGSNLRLDHEQFDPRDDICVEQQHCGGNTLHVFREKVLPGSDFTFESRRHRGYPFGLTIYVNGVEDCRLSACCEYKHSKGAKLGGKLGHFGIVSVTGSSPCYRCQIAEELKKYDKKPKKSDRKAKQEEEKDVSQTVDVTDRRKKKKRGKDTDRSEQTVTGVSDNEDDHDRTKSDVTVPVSDEEHRSDAADSENGNYESDFENDEQNGNVSATGIKNGKNKDEYDDDFDEGTDAKTGTSRTATSRSRSSSASSRSRSRSSRSSSPSSSGSARSYTDDAGERANSPTPLSKTSDAKGSSTSLDDVTERSQDTKGRVSTKGERSREGRGSPEGQRSPEPVKKKDSPDYATSESEHYATSESETVDQDDRGAALVEEEKVRTPSPKERTPSPRERTPSPRASILSSSLDSPSTVRSLSPRERTPSPRELDAVERPSSREPTPIPRERTPSPAAESSSPRERTPSPRERTPSPSERTPSPRERTPSPSERTPSPRERTPSPKVRTPSPKEDASFSSEKSQSRSEGTSLPRERTPSPRERTPPPANIMERSRSSSSQSVRSGSEESLSHKRSAALSVTSNTAVGAPENLHERLPSPPMYHRPRELSSDEEEGDAGKKQVTAQVHRQDDSRKTPSPAPAVYKTPTPPTSPKSASPAGSRKSTPSPTSSPPASRSKTPSAAGTRSDRERTPSPVLAGAADVSMGESIKTEISASQSEAAMRSPEPVKSTSSRSSSSSGSSSDTSSDSETEDEAPRRPISKQQSESKVGESTDESSSLQEDPVRVEVRAGDTIRPMVEGRRDIVIENVTLTSAQVEELGEIIQENGTIHSLTLRTAGMLDSHLEKLADALENTSPVSDLRVLNLNCNLITDGAVPALLRIVSTKTDLKKLYLHGNRLGDSGVEALLSGLLKLHMFRLSDEEKVSAEQLKAIRGAAHSVVEDVMKDVLHNSSLNSVESPSTTESPNRSFNESNARKGSVSGGLSLTTLDIGDCDVGVSGAKKVAVLLETSAHLQTLILSGNRDMASTPEGITPIARALGVNKSVTSLSLDYCDLGNEGIKILAENLKTNTTLTDLDLEGNKIDGEGAQSLIEMLEVNKTLTNVEILQGNYISETDLQSISTALNSRS